MVSSRPRRPLHNFVSLSTWGKQRYFRCGNANGSGRQAAKDQPRLVALTVKKPGLVDLRKRLYTRVSSEIAKENKEEIAKPCDIGPKITDNIQEFKTSDLPSEKVSERKDDSGSGRGGEKEKQRRPPVKRPERVRFRVGLTRREVEQDFKKIAGHKPPSRPKKRPRKDWLCPGMMRKEIYADTYKIGRR